MLMVLLDINQFTQDYNIKSFLQILMIHVVALKFVLILFAYSEI